MHNTTLAAALLTALGGRTIPTQAGSPNSTDKEGSQTSGNAQNENITSSKPPKVEAGNVQPARDMTADPGDEVQSAFQAGQGRHGTLKTETSAGAAQKTSVSSSCPIEWTDSLRQFKNDLNGLISCPKQESAEESSKSKIVDGYVRIFMPWRNEVTLGYDELVAKYVGLWSVLDTPDAQRYSAQALLGLRLLRSGRYVTSSKILSDIEFQTSTPAALSYVMRGVGQFLRSMILILFILGYTVGFFILTTEKVSSTGTFGQSVAAFLNTTLGDVVVAAVAGMLGSVVSLLLRLGEFERTKGRSQMFLTLTGSTLPIVGGVFGAFIAALISSKVVDITIGGIDGLNIWLYLVIGFLSGFSERFSRGFIRIAEDRLGGSADRDDNKARTSSETQQTSVRVESRMAA